MGHPPAGALEPRGRPRRSDHPPPAAPRRARSAALRSEPPTAPRAGGRPRQRGFGTGPLPPMTPVDVPALGGPPGAGAVGVGLAGCTPDGSGAVGCGAPSGAVPPSGDDTPPTAPNGEWIGQNAVGSVPGMNDSM